MKRLFFISGVIGTLLLVLSACSDQVQQLSGNYSYKLSGAMQVVNAKDTTQRTMSEQGALSIVRINADSALVTFNALLGDAYATHARIQDKEISLVPFHRPLTVGLQVYDVTVSGEGTAYDETLLLTMQYAGRVMDQDSMTIHADSLTLLCKKN